MEATTLDAPVVEQKHIPTNQSAEPESDDISPAALASVRQTFGEVKPKYYIFMVGGGAPTRPHGSRFWAEKEAKRLAALFPDKTILVLKVKAAFKASQAEIANAEAITNLKIGQRITISPFHHRNPNEQGEIVAFTKHGAVEVKLYSGQTYDFAPTSLFVDGQPAMGTAVALAEGMGG